MSWLLLVEQNTHMHAQLIPKGFKSGWNTLHDKQPWPHEPILAPVSGSTRMNLHLIVRYVSSAAHLPSHLRGQLRHHSG
jgi:hypothetical protein